jgi:hypothetical protein
MVRLASAMLVATTHLRVPGGAGSKMRVCSRLTQVWQLQAAAVVGHSNRRSHAEVDMQSDSALYTIEAHDTVSCCDACISPNSRAYFVLRCDDKTTHLHLAGQRAVHWQDDELRHRWPQALHALIQRLAGSVDLILACSSSSSSSRRKQQYDMSHGKTRTPPSNVVMQGERRGILAPPPSISQPLSH